MLRTNHSGSAKVSEIARHFGLSADTTRGLLKAARIEPVSRGPERYSWPDVWRLEGVTDALAPVDETLRVPLLTAREVRARFFPHLALRSITDRAARGTLPAIRLGSDWRFRECDMREAAIHG